jgi:hypothetical protein
MTKWDIDLFREQAQAGLQGWYVHFLSEVDTTEGLMGPYGREDIAKEMMNLYLQVEELTCNQILETDALPKSYFMRFHHCQVVQLTPHEFDCLVNGSE